MTTHVLKDAPDSKIVLVPVEHRPVELYTLTKTEL